jgi:hypothetical protein
MATLLNKFHHHSQLMSVQNTSILVCVAEFIKRLQYLHVYIKHMHEKCLQKTVAVGLGKISSCRDETATNGAIYLQNILGITFLQLLVVQMQGEGVLRILMHQIEIFPL